MALSEVVMLVHPQQHAPTCITTDASNRAGGAVLEQFINGQWKPIPFFSKELSPAELKYSAFDHELLAAYLAVQHFQYFVEGRVFNINTDRKPLTFALNSSAERHSPRQALHLAFISEFMTDLRCIKGQANRVADALSRNILALDQSLINLDILAYAQDQDEELLKLSTFPTSLQLAQVPLSHSRRTLLYDISQGRPRPLVPSAISGAIFDKLHPNFVSSCHQGLSSSDFRRVRLAQYEARHCLLDPYLP